MSFSWLGTFRQGSWVEFRRFALEERRDAAKRLSVIQAELARIGEVTVTYSVTTDVDGNETVSEERTGFSVTKGSSLEKLIQAYVAQGGNPFDISMFLVPDKVIYDESTGTTLNTQPHSGVVAPKSALPTMGGGVHQGGFLTWTKYIPARVGGRRELNTSRVIDIVDHSRRWINKEIQVKRNDIEARIIKLCDLREQLLQEIDMLVQAVGGTVAGVPSTDPNRMDNSFHVATLINSIDSVFYVPDEDGVPQLDTRNEEELSYYDSLMDDILPDESNTAL